MAVRKDQYPILEFDESRETIFEPGAYTGQADIPERVVLCFFHDVIRAVAEEREAKVATSLYSEIGLHPVYEIEHEGRRLGFFHPGVGAPLSAFFLEELIALGATKFIVCGGAGALVEVPLGHVIVPSSAVRDEGTSYHYLPPGREVGPSPEGVAAIEAVLEAHGTDFIVGKTWTNDGLYRETPGKVQLRKDEGCVAVEMEAAALFAVARFRGVTLAQMLYAGDDVSGDEFDMRDWFSQGDVRQGLFWLAAEACLRL